MKHARRSGVSKLQQSLKSVRLTFEPLENRHLLTAWLPQGPAPLDNAQVNVPPDDEGSGAIQVIAAHPTDDDILYIGAVNGGIWMTTDATAANPTWTPLTDELQSQSIGALRFDPTDLTYQTLLAGTGRFSNFGGRGDDEAGLYYTTDGGANWSHFNNSNLLNQTFSNAAARGNTLFAASKDSGLFRSTNGGANWSNISGSNGLGAGPVLDLVEDPGNLDRLYAAVDGGTGGIFRTDNATAATPTWTNITAGVTAFGGTTSNMRMAVHDSGGGNAVYVAVVNSGVLAGVYRSANQGAAWTAMDTPVVHNGSQGTTNTSIAADPTNVNIVYIGGDRIASSPFTALVVRGNASLAPGTQFTTIVDGNASNTTPHADSRAMAFDVGGDLLQSDDGGIYRRSNPTSSAGAWSSVNGNLTVMEIHDIAYDPISGIVMSGTQDNGTQFQWTTGSLDWVRILGGDGGDVAIDGVTLAGINHSYRYFSSQNLGHGTTGNFTRTEYDQNNTFAGTMVIDTAVITDPQFVTPIEINAINPSRMLFGGLSDLYESLNITSAGPTITNIGGPGANRNAMVYGGSSGGVPNADLIYVGWGSEVHKRTVSGGGISPTSALPGASIITDVAIDPDEWMTVFAIDSNQVFMSTNAGTSWSDITGTLTSISSTDFRTIEYLPGGSQDAIVVGTRSGAFAATSGSFSSWSEFGTDLPDALVFDLEYDATDDVLVAGTLGRGAWILPDVSDLLGVPATVTARRLFYNNSIWDDPGFGFTNASAIAGDKTAYVPNGSNTSTFASMSSYTKGINGIMLELTGDHGTIAASDFTVKMSGQGLAANNTPSTWTAAPAFTVTLVPDTPTSGTDRYELIWADGAITNRYVYVVVEGNDALGGFNTNTNLAASDYFFFGSMIGDAGSPEFYPNVDALDQVQVRNNQGSLAPPTGVLNFYDFNRDALVDAIDQIVARNNQGAMPWLSLSAPPAAPEPAAADEGDGGAAVASALASSSTAVSPTMPAAIAAEGRVEIVAKPASAGIVAPPSPMQTDLRLSKQQAEADALLVDLKLDDDLLDALLG